MTDRMDIDDNFNRNADKIIRVIQDFYIDPGIRESLRRYVVDRIPTGDFLLACLCNDLQEAFARADFNNRKNMFNIVAFIYNVLPSASRGSPERVERWLNPPTDEDG